jgi:hypothetical protein
MWFWPVSEMIELVSGMPAPQFGDESSWVGGSELVQGSSGSEISRRTPVEDHCFSRLSRAVECWLPSPVFSNQQSTLYRTFSAVTLVFVAAELCLPSRCLPTTASSCFFQASYLSMLRMLTATELNQLVQAITFVVCIWLEHLLSWQIFLFQLIFMQTSFVFN